MKKIIVGSKNPVKVSAVKGGFEKMFPEETFEVEGISVESGVPDQPMGDEETLLGAMNRAKAAHVERPDADYTVGMEGGIVEHGEDMSTYARFIVMQDGEVVGRSRTAEIFLPRKSAELVRSGMELSHANDEVFNVENSKHTEGMTGLLTGGLLPRTLYYETAFYLALAPIKFKEIY